MNNLENPMEDIASHVDHFQTRASLLLRLHAEEKEPRELAWEEFQSRYAPIIRNFAGRCGAQPSDIDDIVQDVMASLAGRSSEFRYDPSKGSFRGYLKTCTVRAALRRAGATLRFRGIPLDQIPEPEEIVEPLWSDAWEANLVSQALKLMRKQQQGNKTYLAFEEYVLKDRSPAVVAAELSISENSVHQAKTRMTKLLREIVSKLRELE